MSKAGAGDLTGAKANNRPEPRMNLAASRVEGHVVEFASSSAAGLREHACCTRDTNEQKCRICNAARAATPKIGVLTEKSGREHATTGLAVVRAGFALLPAIGKPNSSCRRDDSGEQSAGVEQKHQQGLYKEAVIERHTVGVPEPRLPRNGVPAHSRVGFPLNYTLRGCEGSLGEQGAHRGINYIQCADRPGGAEQHRVRIPSPRGASPANPCAESGCGRICSGSGATSSGLRCTQSPVAVESVHLDGARGEVPEIEHDDGSCDGRPHDMDRGPRARSPSSPHSNQRSHVQYSWGEAGSRDHRPRRMPRCTRRSESQHGAVGCDAFHRNSDGGPADGSGDGDNRSNLCRRDNLTGTGHYTVREGRCSDDGPELTVRHQQPQVSSPRSGSSPFAITGNQHVGRASPPSRCRPSPYRVKRTDGHRSPASTGRRLWTREDPDAKPNSEFLNEALIKSPSDMLLFSKKARPVEYKPRTLREYKATKPTAYTELGKLQPDLHTDELIAKRANADRVKEFSINLRKINLDAAARRGTSHPVERATPQDSRSKALAFARKIPRPKPGNVAPARKDEKHGRLSPESGPRELTELEALEALHDGMRKRVQAQRASFRRGEDEPDAREIRLRADAHRSEKGFMMVETRRFVE